MKSLLFSLITGLLALAIGGPTIAKARDKTRVLCQPTGPGELTGGARGYLIVYSATDQFNDGDVPYYAHSSYAIYTLDGKLFKNVENHIVRSDEVPETVALPAGYYVIEARSEREGYVRLRVAMKAGQRTTVDLDLREKNSPIRVTRS